MLNKGKYSEDTGSSCEGNSMYSLVDLVPEENECASTHADADVRSAASGGITDIDDENILGLGVLILDDAENEDGDAGSKRSRKSPSLSMPDTLFLPTEIGSVAPVSVSGITEGKEKNKADENTVTTHTIGAFLRSFHAMITLVMIVALVVTSWTSHVNKKEVLHLREELQKRKTLLPLALSLLMEREVLLEKQVLLELELERAKGKGAGRTNYYDDILAPDESDGEAFLSYKNCYVEASLSLGQCSREWQKWWRADTANSSSTRGTKEETHEEYSSHEYDEEFTEDMSKFIKSFSNSLISATKQSYSSLEKAINDVSYDGLKAAFSLDDSIKSTIKSTFQSTTS